MSFVDIVCGEEFRRSNQLLHYAASLKNLDPRRTDEIEEYNYIKKSILSNLTKERYNPSLRTSTTYHITDDGQNIATTTTLPMPLADYVNVVVHRPTTDNPESASDYDACPYATREEWSLLHVAAAHNDSEMISMLVDHEAHINLQFKTTIFGAYTGHLSHRSRERTYHAKEELDNTPLHLALHNNCPQAAITLLNLGAKFDILNAAEKTAYDLTAKGDEIRTLMQQKDSWAEINNKKAHALNLAKRGINSIFTSFSRNIYS